VGGPSEGTQPEKTWSLRTIGRDAFGWAKARVKSGREADWKKKEQEQCSDGKKLHPLFVEPARPFGARNPQKLRLREQIRRSWNETSV